MRPPTPLPLRPGSGAASRAREDGIHRATVDIAPALPAAGHALAGNVEMEAAGHALAVAGAQFRQDAARVLGPGAEVRHRCLGEQVAAAAVPLVPQGVELRGRDLMGDLEVIAGEDLAAGERRRHLAAGAAAVVAPP